MNIVDGIGRTIRLGMVSLIMMGALLVAGVWLGVELLESQRRAQDLEAQLDQQQQECVQTREELTRAREEQARLEAEIETLRAELSRLHGEMEQLTVMAEQWKLSAEEQARVVAGLRNRLQPTEQQLLELQTQLEANQQALAECSVVTADSDDPDDAQVQTPDDDPRQLKAVLPSTPALPLLLGVSALLAGCAPVSLIFRLRRRLRSHPTRTATSPEPRSRQLLLRRTSADRQIQRIPSHRSGNRVRG